MLMELKQEEIKLLSFFELLKKNKKKLKKIKILDIRFYYNKEIKYSPFSI